MTDVALTSSVSESRAAGPGADRLAGYTDAALRRAGIPIVGVSLPDRDRATWSIQFDPAATDAQQAQAQAVLATLDVSEAAVSASTLAAALDENKLLKAVAIWSAQRLGVPMATARAEILTIYGGL